MSRWETPLFADHELHEVLQHREAKLFEEIDKLGGEQLLNTSIEDLCDYLEQKYKVHPPQLGEDEITVDQHEMDVDVSHDPLRSIPNLHGPVYAKGTKVQYFIPYEGDQELFKCRPSHFSLSPPRGRVEAGEIIITFVLLEHDVSKVKAEFEQAIAQIKNHLEWINSDVSQFNAVLRDKIRQRIENRQQKLLKDQDLVASLGFPLRKRKDAPQTYAVPTVRKKIIPRLPKATTAPFVPEPILDMQKYEHILFVISNMAKVMEMSPKAFKEMSEEDLRTHFLVQLNAQYEGQATGETFNFEGKTDILIRVKNRNIFIAECKFWRGPKLFKEAIDQLLGYASWRDTKIALLVFNRRKHLSRILEQIPKTVKEHPNFKRQLSYPSETGFRFILHHRDDLNRELILTILVFEIPK